MICLSFDLSKTGKADVPKVHMKFNILPSLIDCLKLLEVFYCVYIYIYMVCDERWLLTLHSQPFILRERSDY